MIGVDKDLDALRKEHEQLSTRISRFSLLTLAAVFFFAISFSHGCRAVVNDKEVRTRLCSVKSQSASLSDTSEDIRDFISESFRALPERLTEACPEPSVMPAPSPAPLPPVSPPAQSSSSQPFDATGASTGATQRELNDDDRDALILADMSDEAISLKDRVVYLFTVEVSVLGFKFKINLLYWVPVFPLMLMLAQFYVFVLRTKLRLLRCVGAHCIERGGRDEVTKVDRLLFSGSSARLTNYAKHPASFELVLFTLGMIGIFIYFVGVTIYFWRRTDTDLILGILIFVANLLWIPAFYTLAYGQYVSARLAEQVKSEFGCEVRPGATRRIWEKARRQTASLLGKIQFRPKISLLTGSLLVLATLFLATASSCEGVPRTGYDLVIGSNAAWYFDSGLVQGGYSGAWGLGRMIYILSVALAAVTLLVVLRVYSADRFLSNRRLMSALFLLSGTASLFVISEFFFVVLLNLWFIADLLRLFYWLIPLLLWYACAFLFRRRAQRVWPRIRLTLICLYLPGAIICLETFFEVGSKGLVGLLLYFVGINLLSLTYMQLAERARAAAEDATPPPRAEGAPEAEPKERDAAALVESKGYTG